MGQYIQGTSIGQVEVEDVLRFQHHRITKNLFISFLNMIENLDKEHQASLGKLREKLPAEYAVYVDLADYWDDTRREIIRKQILDVGNDAIRALDEQLVNYDFSIKTGKGKVL